jgi:hypothetical protein
MTTTITISPENKSGKTSDTKLTRSQCNDLITDLKRTLESNNFSWQAKYDAIRSLDKCSERYPLLALYRQDVIRNVEWHISRQWFSSVISAEQAPNVIGKYFPAIIYEIEYRKIEHKFHNIAGCVLSACIMASIAKIRMPKAMPFAGLIGFAGTLLTLDVIENR